MSDLPNHLEERLDSVIAGITTISDALDAETAARTADTESRDAENISRDRRSNRVLVACAVAAFLGVVGIVVGAIGLSRAVTAENRSTANAAHVDALLVSRSAAQKVTCDQANVQAAQHNKLADAFDQVLLIAITPNPDAPPRTPEQQASLDEFYAQSVMLVTEARDPGRDCSPEGIAAFYKN